MTTPDTKRCPVCVGFGDLNGEPDDLGLPTLTTCHVCHGAGVVPAVSLQARLLAELGKHHSDSPFVLQKS